MTKPDALAGGRRPEVQIQTEVIELDDVVRYFVKGYQKPAEIEHFDWYLDPTKGKLVLRLYVRPTPTQEASE